MADRKIITIMEYNDGKSRSEEVSDGYLARANHSIFGLMDNAQEGSIVRYEEMDKFVGGLHSEIEDLDNEEVIALCREVLRSPPILNSSTRSSFSICIELRRVDYMVGDGPWRVFQF